MSISAAQIRAGRGLLNWTAKDLAERIGITPSSMSAIENGQSKGSVQTLSAAEACLTAAGVEFLPGEGVRKRQAAIMELEGTEGFRSLMDLVYASAKDHGGEICLFNGSPDLFIRWLGKDWYADHSARMQALKEKFDFKVVIQDGDLNLIGNQFVEYRWIPKDLFKEQTIYIFDNHVAFLDFEKESVHIRVIQQQALSEAMRTLFGIAWQHVAKPIKSKAS